MLLGIDIGTTKVAAVLVAPNGSVAAVSSHAHEADMPAAPERAEQDPRRLLAAVWSTVCELPADLRRSVARGWSDRANARRGGAGPPR